MAKKNNKPVYLAALLLFLGGFGWLMYSGLSEGSSYFINVSEAVAMEPTKLSSARLFGTVHAHGIEMAQGNSGVRFTIVDKEDATKTMIVNYKGSVPDTFKAGVEVIVEGGMNPSSHEFGANSLMTKCPSKYEKENREKNGIS